MFLSMFTFYITVIFTIQTSLGILQIKFSSNYVTTSITSKIKRTTFMSFLCILYTMNSFCLPCILSFNNDIKK